MARPRTTNKPFERKDGTKLSKAGESCYQRKSDGRWLAEFKYIDPETGLEKSRTCTGKTEDEALRRKAEFLAAIERGLSTNPKDKYQLLGVYLERWLAEVVKPHKRPKTYRSYEQNVRLYLAPKQKDGGLGDFPLAGLNQRQIQKFVNAQQAKGHKANTVARMRDVLKNALNHAMKVDGLIDYNPAAMSIQIRPDAHTDDEEVEALTPGEALTLLDSTADHRLAPLFSVALGLGLRQGEILGLRWKNVDLERRTMRVREQIQRVDGVFTFAPTKSEESRRIVGLPAFIVDALRAQQDRLAFEKRAAGEKWEEWGLVFPTSTGRPMDGPNLTRYFQAALRRAGLPMLTFHQLRGSCASILKAQGATLDEVSSLLGHSDVRLTKKVYLHQFEESRQRPATIADAWFGQRQATEEAQGDKRTAHL